LLGLIRCSIGYVEHCVVYNVLFIELKLSPHINFLMNITNYYNKLTLFLSKILLVQTLFVSLIRKYYNLLNALPRFVSIPVLFVSAAAKLAIGLLSFIFFYEPFYWGSWKALLHAPGMYFYIGEIVGHWIQSFRDCWLWSSIAFGPLPASEMYYYTLLSYWQEYPWLVVYNLFLTVYVVISLQYFGLILKALILKKKVLNLTVRFWHTLLGMLLLIVILVVFVWCPPVFGFGVPYHFNNILHPWQDILDAYPECFDNVDEVCRNCLGFVLLFMPLRTSTCFSIFFCLSMLVFLGWKS
jgi:hypothetical protein